MTAIETLLAGLIDYAGLYPPAGLDMPTAVRNYRGYQDGPHAYALGRFIVDIARNEELRDAARNELSKIPLSVIATPEVDPKTLSDLAGTGFRIESVEIRCAEPAALAELGRRLPQNLERYIEVPIAAPPPLLDLLATSHLHAKLRMGGVVPEAFPDARSVALLLKELLSRNIAFKATAGLHHPIRSRHSLTYSPDSPEALMHGFLNLACASALIHAGWPIDEAQAALEDEDANVWDVSAGVITWRRYAWSTAPLRDMRSFFKSFGSCSFVEPISDLEALKWL